MRGKDVTEQYIDVQARLKNKYVLRDRLKQILEKAVTVQDVLAVETELNRVQSDIDSMEGQIKSLQGQVQYATLDLDLKRKQILGPLGYVFKGIWWGVEKLFIIRE
jgi:chromosome segregation ATPase